MKRRDLLKAAFGAGVLLPCAVTLTSCSANGLVGILDLVGAGLNAALPILALVLPPPYNALLPLLAKLFGVLNTAIASTATVLQKNEPALQQAKDIEAAWAAAILDPTVISQLPSTPISSTNPNSVQSLVQALVTAANNFLGAIAAAAGLSTSTTSSNALVSISGLTAAVAKAQERMPIGNRFTVSGEVNRRHLAKIKSDCAEYGLILAKHGIFPATFKPRQSIWSN